MHGPVYICYGPFMLSVVVLTFGGSPLDFFAKAWSDGGLPFHLWAHSGLRTGHASPSRPSCEPLFGRFSLSYGHLVVIIILSVYIWVTYPWYWSLKYCISLWFALTLTPQPEWSVSVFKTVCIRCKHCQHCRGVFSSAFSLCEKSCSYFLWLPFSKKPANMPPERSGGSK